MAHARGHGPREEEHDEIARAVAAYAERYRELEPNPERVVLLLEVDRVMGSVR